MCLSFDHFNPTPRYTGYAQCSENLSIGTPSESRVSRGASTHSYKQITGNRQILTSFVTCLACTSKPLVKVGSGVSTAHPHISHLCTSHTHRRDDHGGDGKYRRLPAAAASVPPQVHQTKAFPHYLQRVVFTGFLPECTPHANASCRRASLYQYPCDGTIRIIIYATHIIIIVVVSCTNVHQRSPTARRRRWHFCRR
jgi:hypothetical protein